MNNSQTKKRIMSTNNKENVQVTVRCRPPGRNEFNTFWEIIEDSRVCSKDNRLKRQHEFMFDHAFHGSDNKALYLKSVNNLINQAMEGFNATVFAYGQTASGKTFTMMGTETEPGVIPRSVSQIFDFIKKAATREFLLRVSYLEIYNETIKDLLNPSNDNLKIQQDKIRGVYVTPLTEEVVTCAEDVMRIIERGEANRHISSTDYNLHSSRSHTLFQMIIESRERSNTSTSLVNRRTLTSSIYNTKQSSSSKETVRISQLNLIDLAGSEKAATDEDRRKEGSYINKSLLTLGTVISKLTETSKQSNHIPFRDSKLTRILQTALTGFAKVAVICTISPASLEESLNTLKFASRVKRITIHAKNNEVMDDKALLQKYRNEIADLKSKLQQTTQVLQKEKEVTESAILAERRDHDQQIRQMQSVRNAMKERIDHLTRLILTSSSVVMNDATAELLVADDPSVLKANNTSRSPTNGDNTSIIIHNLRQQLYKTTKESKEKDQRILALEEQLRQQTAFISQLEISLSITKAELEVTQLLVKKREEEEKEGEDIFMFSSQPQVIIN
ncbi:P-loop containing nucleoside triphosphate hydrolase protein [Cokeromyces recurvatus]|uniref:P-loop containing nucleoside triphosphate hydrolase protein n=1 Tax=Cokeromyces recurvatus TaxID=90255 RepID=UPI0022205342|nr:P-loop containing nucleoside triphosphate hydrolase protein [Cokeromyces recurvatus]KAI7902099.1 P-loop containing nucleoside triphosphate hydrolase protein [Cokeromyces recurvatus]